MAGVTMWSAILCSALIFCFDCSEARTFGIDYENDTFVLDGKPFRYVSGSIHYSRVPYQYWMDRLTKMFAAGLNAIQVYIPWNIHEPFQGQYDFSGQQDVVTFLKLAHSIGLYVILRPGPYICAEWEFGGFPAWLLKGNSDIRLRSSDPRYIKAVDQWFDVLLSEIAPLLYVNGGPIISVQVENEYGSYFACDYDYLRFLRQKMIDILGNDVVLFTTDGDGIGYLRCGTLQGLYTTVDFGITYNPAQNFNVQRVWEPKGPLVNSEFYTGWLDHWGESHSHTDAAAFAKSLDLLLAYGANVNMYMFEGGTNFGFWNGAEYPPFKAIPTSYDYDAPLSEAGDITEKYVAIRQVISKYYPPPPIPIPPSTPKFAYGKITMNLVATIPDYLEKYTPGGPIKSKYPINMEEIDHYYGFVMYRHILKDNVSWPTTLDIMGVRDRGYVMINQIPFGIIERDKNTSVNITGVIGDYLDVLVENQARINYGNNINDNRKGLITNVTHNGDPLTDWLIYPLLENITLVQPFSLKHSYPKQNGHLSTPALYAGQLVVPMEAAHPMDTYFDMSLWTKGQIWMNNFNLGRYWPAAGPQIRLYVPKPVLKQGENTVIMLELESSPCIQDGNCFVTFMDQPLINGTVHPFLGHRHGKLGHHGYLP
ncbi:hypothetical protein ACJMK2_032589 [Sinanodonta woodiana]|uniref:Beta-galactosidase n=1 Tax=Sinanodonta woodiana TaxID=1069815 RepID=A0ABD3X5Q0_SINWO